MKSASSIFQVARLGRQRQMLLAEALGEVSLASAVIALAPFRTAIALGARGLGTASLAPADSAEIIALVHGSVETAARRVPWRALCFQQGLALQRMLRRRGIQAKLHYGIAKKDDGEIEAHVWITADNTIVIGGEAAAGFATVAIFPSS